MLPTLHPYKNRLYALCLTCCILICSCEETERLQGPPTSGIPIVFTEKTRDISKGTPVSGENLPSGSSFGVYTFRIPEGGAVAIPGDVLPNNQPVYKSTGNNNLCHYTPEVLWPTTEGTTLKFFARYPHNATGVTTQISSDPSDPYIAFTCTTPTDVPTQIDLMYAVTGNLSRVAVPLVFQHAFTQVSFVAKLAEDRGDGATVKISRIALRDVIIGGTMTVRGVLSEWVLKPTSTANFNFAGGQLSGVQLNTNDYQPVFASNMGSMLLLPQPLDKMTLLVEIAITMTDGSVKTENNYFFFPETAPWTQGKHIEYQISAVRDAIHLFARVRGWDTSVPSTDVVVEH